MNVINVTLNAITIIFFIFLLGVYLSKKNMDNIENKLYRLQLLLNGCVVLSHFIYLFVGGLVRDNIFLAELTVKIYMIFLNSFFFIIVYYIVVVANENNKKMLDFYNKNKKIINIVAIIFNIIYDTIMVLCPVEIHYTADGILSDGSGLSFYIMVLYILALIAVGVIIVIIRRKSLNKKKVAPFIILGILTLITLVSIILFPWLCITVVFTTMVSYLMFHTIENPDIKLVSQLELARDQAEKSNKAKSEFLSSMSHELRTPLNAIVGLSQIVESSDSWDEVKEDSHEILMASQKLLEMVDGILDINSLDNNDIEIHNANYNIYDVFNDIEKNINLRIGEKNIEFRSKISSDIPKTLNGDKAKVKSIINNILTNAIKYTEEGFVEFEASCFIVKDRCNLRFSVSDTGKGIKEEDIPYLFDKFYRSEENKDSDIEGAGLGLAITKSMVDLMEGKINVTSTYGEGTTFFVSISQKIVEDDKSTDTEIL